MKELKRWQIPLFAFASFGPCMLSTIISVYLVDPLRAAVSRGPFFSLQKNERCGLGRTVL